MSAFAVKLLPRGLCTASCTASQHHLVKVGAQLISCICLYAVMQSAAGMAQPPQCCIMFENLSGVSKVVSADA